MTEQKQRKVICPRCQTFSAPYFEKLSDLKDPKDAVCDRCRAQLAIQEMGHIIESGMIAAGDAILRWWRKRFVSESATKND